MLSTRKAFSAMNRLQRTLSTVFYIISVIAIYAVLAGILIELLHAGSFVIIASALLYLVVAVVFGAYMMVISYIPSNLAGAFDPIKNDIANRQIQTSDELARRLVSFLDNFFNFAFLDVACSLVRIGDNPPVHSYREAEIDAAELTALTRESYDLRYLGKKKIDGSQLHGYLVPVWFGDQWLGFFAVFTPRRLRKLFASLLGEFENMYLDDQLMHVLDYQELQSQEKPG